MYDINFYRKIYNLKKRIYQGEMFDKDFLIDKMEKFRSDSPVVFNIETTNVCNMRCIFCPRTTKMTRKNETLDMGLYKKVIDDIRPWTKTEWDKWVKFCEENYKVSTTIPSENNFFLYIVPNVITLHGFGSPLLDKNITKRVKMLTDKNISSYFSCNAANVNISKIEKIFDSNLTFLKFSVDSVDDKKHKELRGQCSDFNDSYKKIMKILEIIDKKNYNTTIVVTMIDLGLPNQLEDYHKLQEIFKDTDVYLYLKSQDVRWYRDNDGNTRSIHWSEFCQFPWSSVTITAGGKVSLCAQDYNDMLIFGNLSQDSLQNIWKGNKFKEFREKHFNLDPYLKCSMECDMKLVGEFIRN